MTETTDVAADQLKSIIARLERLLEEVDALKGDIKEVYAEAGSNGFDVKTLRRIIAIRRKDHDERQEEEALLDTYLSALGMA
ncbi:DUF2312 domain-containing protein [Methylorubrum thiocyanatum]|uniref:DUF2312 domain-containing protein n=1 Tax=Methylorubrum thiocyanatum TaxID=47958 RepID=UPI0035C8131D